MQITRLSVANVRPVHQIDLDLSTSGGEPRRRVVLLGANGAGKTTILDAIAHLFQLLDASADGLGARLLGAGDVRDVPPSPELPKPPRSGRIGLSAVFTDRERHRLRSSVPDPPAAGAATFEIGDPWDFWLGEPESEQLLESSKDEFSREKELEVQEDVGMDAIGDDEEADLHEGEDWGLDGLADSLVDSPQIGEDPFKQSARLTLQGSRPPCVLMAADRGVLDLRDDLAVRDVVNFNPRIGCLSKDRARFAPLAARLALAWNNERNDPGGAMARMWKVLGRYFPELPTPVHVDGLMLWFKNRDGSTVPLPSLSDGERAILLIFTEVAIRAPEDGVVLIDEIEQHLHPKWQRAVLEGLTALVPTAQFIVTSQSPYVAATAPDDLVKVGDWDRDGA